MKLKITSKVLLLIIAIFLIDKAIELIGTAAEDGPYYGVSLSDNNNIQVYVDRIPYKNGIIEAVKFENYEFPVIQIKKRNKIYQIIGLKELISHQFYKNYQFKRIKFNYIEKWLTYDLIYFHISWDGREEVGYLFISKFGYFKKYYIAWNW